MNRFVILLALLWLVACKKDTKIVNPGERRLVTKVEGPVTGTANQPLVLTVSWAYSNGCQSLDKFVETVEGNIRSIWSYGSTSTGVCTQDAGIKTKIYSFTAVTAGAYELRFYEPDMSFISHTIIIN